MQDWCCCKRHFGPRTSKPKRARALAHRWTLLATILGSSMAFLGGTAVNVALPALQLVAVRWVQQAFYVTGEADFGLTVVGSDPERRLQCADRTQ